VAKGLFGTVRCAVIVMAIAMALPSVAFAQTWTASHQFPINDPRDQVLQTLAREMAAQGLVIRIFPAASLLRPHDQWSGLKNGSVEVVFIPADYLAERFPHLSALSLPGMIRDHAHALKIGASAPMRELRRQIEAEGVTVLADSWVAGTSGGRRKCVLSPNDVKGLRARTIGAYMDEVWSAAGAIPVSAATSDTLPLLMDNDLVDIANTSVTTLLTLRMRSKFACLTVPGPAGALWYLWEPILVSRRSLDALDEPRRLAGGTAPGRRFPGIRRRGGQHGCRHPGDMA
jgi:TRAP-type C4-dicarboxylate transport system substrate-binding protein